MSNTKRSISLPAPIAEDLTSIASRLEANVSEIIESAIRAFKSLPLKGQKQFLHETIAGKGFATRTDWMNAFWDALAELFGTTDPYRGNGVRVYGPRHYHGFLVIFLLHGMGEVPPEEGEFNIHVAELPGHDVRPPACEPYTFDLPRDASVYEAARAVAERIQKYAPISA